MKEKDTNAYLSIAQAAAYLGVSKKSLYRWHQNKTLIPDHRIGSTGYRRYTKEQLDDFLNASRNTEIDSILSKLC